MRRFVITLLCCILYLSQRAQYVESAADKSIFKRGFVFWKPRQKQQSPLPKWRKNRYRRGNAYVVLDPLEHLVQPLASDRVPERMRGSVPVDDSSNQVGHRQKPRPSTPCQAGLPPVHPLSKLQQKPRNQRLMALQSARATMTQESDDHDLALSDDSKGNDDDSVIPFRHPSFGPAKSGPRRQFPQVVSSSLIQGSQAMQPCKLPEIDRGGKGAIMLARSAVHGESDRGLGSDVHAAPAPLVRSFRVASKPFSVYQNNYQTRWPSLGLVRSQQEEFRQKLKARRGMMKEVAEDGLTRLRLPLDDRFVIPLNVYNIKKEPFDSGTYGNVYFARSKLDLTKCVVVKRMNQFYAQSVEATPNNCDPFNELQILTSKLPKHPLIVEILGYSYERFWATEPKEDRHAPLAIPSAVFQYYEGGALSEYVTKKIRRAMLPANSLSPVDLVRRDANDAEFPEYPLLSRNLHRKNILLIHDILEALLHLKQHHILHRDLKPANILLTFREGRNRAVLADFGLAIDLEDRGLERYGLSMLVYTAQYRAPEIMDKWHFVELQNRAADWTKALRLEALALQHLQEGTAAWRVRKAAYGEIERLLKEAEESLHRMKRRCREEYSYPAEIWSLAIIIIELYMGCSPFEDLKNDMAFFHFMKQNLRPVKEKNGEMRYQYYLETVRRAMGDDNMFALLLQMLLETPHERISVEELVHHPFFTNID